MTSQQKVLIVFAFFVLSLTIQEVSCNMQCNVLFGVCPNNPLTPDDEFCCENSAGAVYCCDSGEYIKQYGLAIVVPVVLILAVAVAATGCLCCFCCPCCTLYKRRHNGTVYGRVQPPTAVVTVQQPAPPYPGAGAMPIAQPIGAPIPQPGVYLSTGGYPDYSSMQGQQHQQQAPPPYNIATANEGYAKQSPFNPNY